ncbi:alginate lyase [Mucilaginibacter yixingensis]|uniref:Alginate lyase n=1 Tax=Mucilaginibacter yixingensis TaxID=1295612 RepID=A0A2T5JEI7_9SPHI|nr:alginate lyase family protein [Mucilaginibacter yixingensis]PTR00804.1 alginate lyase [Mucilaginibacter yixingensis]
MKRIFFLLCLAATTMYADAQVVSLNKAELQKLKKLTATDTSAQKRYAEWKRAADAALNDQPNPIDTIHTEGRLQGDPKKIASWEAFKDLHKMYALALVYRVDGGKNYLDKATTFLLAWADKNKPNGDPIDDTNLDPAVEAYDLIKNDLNATDKTKISAWLSATAQMEINKLRARSGTASNNWHSHRLKEVGEIGFAIGDQKFQQWAIDGLQQQIATNLLPDGQSFDFKERDALHYHTYDLEPMLTLAIILKRATGVDYYNYVSPAQTSVKKSVEWFLPFVEGAKTHPEFVNSRVEFDKKRARNGEKGYIAGTLFEPKNGLGVLYLLTYFSPDAINIIQKVSGTTENYPNWQLVLNQVRL